MTIEELYARAEAEGIEIDEVPMRELRAVSFPEGWVAIDPRKFETMTELKCELAHEIGHCETGSFYNIYSPFDLKEKCERKACRRAAEILMPLAELRRVIRRSREIWALADYFDVTQAFAVMALELYGDELTREPHERPAILSQLKRAKDLLPNPAPVQKPAPAAAVKPAAARSAADRQIAKNMQVLRRLGIITDNWRDDPLLNLPDWL